MLTQRSLHVVLLGIPHIFMTWKAYPYPTTSRDCSPEKSGADFTVSSSKGRDKCRETLMLLLRPTKAAHLQFLVVVLLKVMASYQFQLIIVPLERRAKKSSKEVSGVRQS